MKSVLKRFLIFILILLFLVFNVAPILWIVAGSFKTHYQNIAIPPALVFTPTLENYKAILQGLPHYFLNSFVIALASVSLSLILGVPAAYALNRLKIKGKENIKMWILSIRMGPPFAFMVPFYLIMQQLRLLDTQISLILVYTTFNLTFLIWLLEGFIGEIPLALEESALIDGCSRLDVLRRITLPLVAPGIIATATLCFISSWNEYIFALILTREAAMTVPLAIATRVSFMNICWEEMCAYSTLATLPTMGLCLLFRKYLVRGLTFGAIKG